jgi:hypothetical protein
MLQAATAVKFGDSTHNRGIGSGVVALKDAIAEIFRVVGQSDFHGLPYCLRYVRYNHAVMQAPTKKKVTHQ